MFELKLLEPNAIQSLNNIISLFIRKSSSQTLSMWESSSITLSQPHIPHTQTDFYIYWDLFDFYMYEMLAYTYMKVVWFVACNSSQWPTKWIYFLSTDQAICNNSPANMRMKTLHTQTHTHTHNIHLCVIYAFSTNCVHFPAQFSF